MSLYIFLNRSLISSFASNWTSACEVEFWVSEEVSSMPGLNTEHSCTQKHFFFHYFALRKGLLPDRATVDSQLVLFILSLHTNLYPGWILKYPWEWVHLLIPGKWSKPRISALMLAAADKHPLLFKAACSRAHTHTCTCRQQITCFIYPNIS